MTNNERIHALSSLTVEQIEHAARVFPETITDEIRDNAIAARRILDRDWETEILEMTDTNRKIGHASTLTEAEMLANIAAVSAQIEAHRNS